MPDLRRMSQTTYEHFDAIVRGGLLKQAGTASFADVLSASDTEAVRAFILDWAQRSRHNDPSASRMPVVTTSSDEPHATH